jgi:branched-chain amino acid transport system substrate-binding protein
MAGHPTVPVTVDAVDSVGAAPAADRALATAGAAVVLEAGASSPAVEAAGIAHITVSDTAVALAGRDDSGFLRAVADDAAEGIGDANFVVGTLGAKTVAVVDDASTTGRAVADYVRDALPTLGAVDVVDVDAVPTPVSDATVASQIAAAHPAATFYGGGFAGLRSLQDALAATTWGGSVVAGGGAFDPAAAAVADPATDGAVISCVCDDTASDSAATTFTTAYQAAYGTLPPPFAAEAFDATNFALAGVSSGAATSGTLAAYLRSRTYDGLTKTLRFDARGEAVGAPVYLYGLKGGQLTRAGTTPGG